MSNDKTAEQRTAPETGREGTSTKVKARELYVLTRRYWDGTRIHERGSKLHFGDGEGPKDKELFSEVEEREIFEDRPLTTAGNEKKRK